MKKVLVTGASGYIGSHVCKILKEQGHHITAWDLQIHNEYNDIFKYVDFFEKIDVTDPIPKRLSFDAVIHLAGLTSVPDSIHNPYDYYRVNIQGTANCLNNIRTDNFIFAGTAASWDMASPYAISKVAAEDIIKEKAPGYTIFRFFNVSGTNGVFKQLGNGMSLIRMIARTACGKNPILEVFGDDYNTRDGTCIRDFVHVIDLANALVKSVETGPSNTPYECVGSEQGYSVLETLRTMETVIGKKIPMKISERRQGDVIVSIVENRSPLLTITKTLEDMCRDQYNLERKLK